MSDTQTQLYFFYIDKKPSENDIKKTIPFKMTPKIIRNKFNKTSIEVVF